MGSPTHATGIAGPTISPSHFVLLVGHPNCIRSHQCEHHCICFFLAPRFQDAVIWFAVEREMRLPPSQPRRYRDASVVEFEWRDSSSPDTSLSRSTIASGCVS
eukprot:1756231-Rhodomonas_salina.1